MKVEFFKTSDKKSLTFGILGRWAKGVENYEISIQDFLFIVCTARF